jgi:outer membrane lipoprotein-sorting protein
VVEPDRRPAFFRGPHELNSGTALDDGGARSFEETHGIRGRGGAGGFVRVLGIEVPPVDPATWRRSITGQAASYRSVWARPQFRMAEMLSAVLPERPSTGETLTSQQQKTRTLTCFPLHPTLLFSRWSPVPPPECSQRTIAFPRSPVRGIPLSAVTSPLPAPSHAAHFIVPTRGVSCTMKIDRLGRSGTRSNVSSVYALKDGRYREERSSCVVVFDGTALWMSPRADGPVLRSSAQPTVLDEMLNPCRLFESHFASTRPAEHAGRSCLAVALRAAEDATDADHELIVDVESGMAIFWRNRRTGREVSISDVQWDVSLDEAMFHFEPEAHHSIIEVTFA